MLIGLAGGYCAGKNAVAALLEARGWYCIDVDKLGHEAVDLARDAIVARFGEGVLAPGGSVDRRAVARIIFADPRALADQEAIIHPVAKRLLAERIAAAEGRAREHGAESLICVNAALLHRTELIGSFAAVIEVRACLATRLGRGMRRDRVGAREALRRILAQRGFRAALRRAAHEAGRPVLVLRNSRGEAELARALDAVLDRITRDRAAPRE